MPKETPETPNNEFQAARAADRAATKKAIVRQIAIDAHAYALLQQAVKNRKDGADLPTLAELKEQAVKEIDAGTPPPAPTVSRNPQKTVSAKPKAAVTKSKDEAGLSKAEN